MKKKSLIILCLIMLLAIITFLLLKFGIKPSISYDKSILLNNKKSFETVATVCQECYNQDAVNDETLLYCIDADVNNLFCYRNDKYHMLTSEQRQEFNIVKSVFLLDHHGLENIFVNNNFVVFGIENGRASFIFSLSDKKPNFVNSPNEENKYIFIEKIDDNWYYACLQD